MLITFSDPNQERPSSCSQVQLPEPSETRELHEVTKLPNRLGPWQSLIQQPSYAAAAAVCYLLMLRPMWPILMLVPPCLPPLGWARLRDFRSPSLQVHRSWPAQTLPLLVLAPMPTLPRPATRVGRRADKPGHHGRDRD